MDYHISTNNFPSLPQLYYYCSTLLTTFRQIKTKCPLHVSIYENGANVGMVRNQISDWMKGTMVTL